MAGFRDRVSAAGRHRLPPHRSRAGTRTLTSIEWEADTPPGTRLFLQTRTSRIKSEATRYFKGTGEEVTKEQYDKLQKPNDKVKIPDNLLKGDIVTEEIMGSDSSAWSDPYLVPGARITSPSPRKYVQVRATLLSDTPEAAATLKAIRLNYTDPLADGFLGELSPTQVDSLAVEKPFSLYIRPRFTPGNPGFDGLLLTAPEGMRLGFSSLYAGAEADLLAADGLDELAATGPEPSPTGEDSLLVTFPLIGPGEGAELLRLDFSGELFSVGGVVQAFARLGDGAGEVVWQQVDEGDAAAGDRRQQPGRGRHAERQGAVRRFRVAPAPSARTATASTTPPTSASPSSSSGAAGASPSTSSTSADGGCAPSRNPAASAPAPTR